MKLATKILSALCALALVCGGLLPLTGRAVHADTTNLIANASVETGDPANASLPQNWLQGGWGTNTRSYSYAPGHTGSRSVSVQVSSYTSGDAKWYFAPVTVSPGTAYTYSDYYQSTVGSAVVAQFDDGAGNYTYQDLTPAAANLSWTAYSTTFTTAANTHSVTIFHLIAGVGSLTTDDFSLTSGSGSGDTGGSTGGSTTGTNLVANDSLETADPANSSLPQNWLQGGWGTNTRSYSYLSSGHTGSRSARVQITGYTSGDAKWYFAPVAISSGTSYSFSDYYTATIPGSVVAQFDDGAGNYTYQDLGSTAASSGWQQYQTTFTAPASARNVTIFHLIAGVGSLTTDDFSLTSGSGSGDNTAPTASLVTPQANATVHGTVPFDATAAGTAIAKVQFKVDGQNAGSALTAAPYIYNWDSTSVSNGTHTVSALATASDGQTATTGNVSITVSNTSSNLVPNASVETADPNDSTSPQNWYEGSWGGNNAVFSYAGTGHTGSRSVRISMTNFTDGGANWSYDFQDVTAGKVYAFSDYYQSNTASQAAVAVQMSDGSTQYIWLGNPYTSDGTWTRFFATFTMPAGAVSAVAYHSIASNGYLMTDDYSFQQYTPQGFNQPLVSVTFDDGIKTQYTNGLPVLQKYGLKATYYIISGYLDLCDPDINSICYMSSDDVTALHNAGDEIGSHTVDHPDLTTISATQVNQELSTSQTALQTLLGVPVTDFASPYGDVNLSVLNSVQQYYVSHRGVQIGYNSIDNYNQQDLFVQDINSSTTTKEVKSYIDYAKATNTWLILMYHDINTDDSADPGYNILPSAFDTQMAYLKASGVQVVTIKEGLETVAPQVGH